MLRLMLAAAAAVSVSACAYRSVDPVRDINQAVTELDRSLWPELPSAKPLKPEAVKPLK